MTDIHDKALTIVERVPERAGMSPVIAAIIERNLNPETVREMLAVQRAWEADEARKAYAAALIGLKADLPTIIAHDKLVNFNTTKYTHSSLGAVVEAVTPHLINHGFVCNWYPATERPNEVAVTCRMTHRGGHFEQVTLCAPPDTKGAKSGAQSVMSTVTMLERYTILALLGIATADMQEPASEEKKPDPTKVDSQRNLRAVGRLRVLGKTREEAEAFLERKVANWTEDDLARLKAWANPDAPGGE